MDILDIDAISFAARTAQVAAAELYGLLAHGAARPIVNWYDGSGVELSDAKIEDDVGAMAAYVAKRKCTGETLYIWNFQNRRATGDNGSQIFADQSFARRLAYELFATTMVNVAWKLLDAQADREAELEQLRKAAAPAPAPRIEDTIYEKEESLHALRPEAAAASQAQAGMRIEGRKKKARQMREKRLQAAAEAAAWAKSGTKPGKAMSIGETAATPPVNRGGRGKRKAKG